MNDTLAMLAREAEEFEKEQTMTNKEFDAQKEQIYANDRRRETYNKQIQILRENIRSKTELKNQKQKELSVLTARLQSLRRDIDNYKIYYEFLKDLQDLSEEFSTTDGDDQGVMQIIRRHKTLDDKRTDLINHHKKVQNQKDEKIRHLQQLRADYDDKIMTYGSNVKDMKLLIDELNEENMLLESEIEGKLNENNERLTEIGQIIFSIRNLYEDISGEERSEKTVVEMLNYIKDERKKLKDIMELYQRPDDKKKA